MMSTVCWYVCWFDACFLDCVMDGLSVGALLSKLCVAFWASLSEVHPPQTLCGFVGGSG